MSYTFYHCGILIGTSELEGNSPQPRQRGGVFWPTSHGLQLFPHLAGMLSAMHALRAHLEANGVSTDEVAERDMDRFLQSTAPGRRVCELVRMLSDVEMRAADNRRVEFASIAFSEPTEIKRLVEDLGIRDADFPAELPPDTPKHIVSVTLRRPLREPASAALAE